MQQAIFGLLGTVLGGLIGYLGSIQHWRIVEQNQALQRFDDEIRVLLDTCHECLAHAREYWLNSHLLTLKELRSNMGGRWPMFKLTGIAIHTAPELRTDIIRAIDAMLKLDNAPVPVADQIHAEVTAEIYRLIGIVSEYRNSKDAGSFKPPLWGGRVLREPKPFISSRQAENEAPTLV